MRSLILLLVIVGLSRTLSGEKPIWILGHMVNSIKQIDEFLQLGSNALESDINFSDNGVPEYTHHGNPCECWRICSYSSKFPEFLDVISNITTPGTESYRSAYVLQYFDIKIQRFTEPGRRKAIENLARQLIISYYKNGTINPTLKFIIGMPKPEDSQLVPFFQDIFKNQGLGSLINNFGWDIWDNGDLDKLNSLWKSANVTNNVWQSDGDINCNSRCADRITQILNLRDSGSYMRKVYYWTVDRKATMKTLLDLGVDGIITNRPNLLKTVINEEGFRNRFRLATLEDDPFEKTALSETRQRDRPNLETLEHMPSLFEKSNQPKSF